MEKRKLSDIEITELFLVKADWERTYVGEIHRRMNETGKLKICGSVVVNEGKIWSVAETPNELGFFMDSLCVMKLDGNLHKSRGETIEVAGTPLFIN